MMVSKSDRVKYETKALVDNWLLELSAELIDSSYSRVTRNENTKPVFWRIIEPLTNKKIKFETYSKYSRYGFYGYGSEYKKKLDQVSALLHFIDIIILNDKILYNSKYAQGWQQSYAFKYIRPSLESVSMNEIDKNSLKGIKKVNFLWEGGYLSKPESNSGIVEHGARYYIALSNYLKASYWPSPRRSHFIEELSDKVTNTSSIYLLYNDIIEYKFTKILNDVFGSTKNRPKYISFPGFALQVLSNCDNIESILPTSLEIKNTKECKAFRAWHGELEIALRKGNLKKIAESMRDVEDLFRDLRKILCVDEKKPDEIQLNIGLSPSIKISPLRLLKSKSMFKHMFGKPYNVIFLRKHLTWAVENSNLRHQIQRLFPFISNYDLKIENPKPILSRLSQDEQCYW